jgi:hypothetical protein
MAISLHDTTKAKCILHAGIVSIAPIGDLVPPNGLPGKAVQGLLKVQGEETTSKWDNQTI